MFSLIIAIVSIALIVALVAATMYHGGDTLTQGRAKADAAALVAGAQQVSGAAVMHLSLEGTRAAAIGDLVTKKYLASVPTVGALALATTGTAPNLQYTVTGTAASDDVCVAVNKAAGLTGTVTATELANTPYGCLTATKAFSFKY